MTTEPKDELPAETIAPAEASVAPQVAICFLLITGRRKTMTFDSDMLTIGRVKELVWNAWDDEWDANRPPAPSSLRLLYFGKLLQDADTLKKLKFPSYTPSSTSESTQPPVTSIVHVSIRPFDPTAPDADMKKKQRRRASSTVEGETTEPGTGCCCIVC